MSAEASLGPRALATAAPRAEGRLAALNPDRLVVVGLVAADSLALAAAFALAYFLRFGAGIPLLQELPDALPFYASVGFWAVPVWLVVFSFYRLYDRHYLFAGLHEYTRVVNACSAGTLVLVVMSFFDLALVLSRGWLVLAWLLSILLAGASRFTARRVIRQLRRNGLLVTPTIIVGTNEEARALAEQFQVDSGSGTRVLGFVGSQGRSGGVSVEGLPVLGTLADVEALVRLHRAREVVVATSSVEREELLELYGIFGRDPRVELRLSSGLFEVLTTGVRVHEISSVPLMTPQSVRITGLDAAVKSAVDYVGATCGLVLLSPLFLVMAILVKIDSPGPVFHRRSVLGRGGKPYDAFKFRTMVVNADEVLAADEALHHAFHQEYKLKDDPRVTRVGRLLRRTSLDELPQLANVLRGEMSLVGPRMIAPEEAPRYGRWQLNLLTVKPGITGPWQVQGRADVPYDERVRLSMHYIRNYSIWFDLEILLRTALVVLRGRGAY